MVALNPRVTPSGTWGPPLWGDENARADISDISPLFSSPYYLHICHRETDGERQISHRDMNRDRAR